MKSFIFLLSILLSSVLVLGQTETEQKALSVSHSITNSYNLNQQELDILEQQCNDFASGLNSYNAFFEAINTITEGKNPIETGSDIYGGATLEYNGILEFGPYNRRYGVNYNSSNLCNASSSASSVGSNVYYDVIKFKAYSKGDFNIEVNSMTGSYSDSYLFLYCDFDSEDPANKLVAGNDDNGISVLSKLSLTDLPAGEYDLVVTTYASNHQNCEFNLSVTSNSSFMLDGKTVPVGFSTILIAFGILFSIALIRFRKRIF